MNVTSPIRPRTARMTIIPIQKGSCSNSNPPRLPAGGCTAGWAKTSHLSPTNSKANLFNYCLSELALGRPTYLGFVSAPVCCMSMLCTAELWNYWNDFNVTLGILLWSYFFRRGAHWFFAIKSNGRLTFPYCHQLGTAYDSSLTLTCSEISLTYVNKQTHG